jgi:hypothetical protein
MGVGLGDSFFAFVGFASVGFAFFASIFLEPLDCLLGLSRNLSWRLEVIALGLYYVTHW